MDVNFYHVTLNFLFLFPVYSPERFASRDVAVDAKALVRDAIASSCLQSIEAVTRVL